MVRIGHACVALSGQDPTKWDSKVSDGVRWVIVTYNHGRKWKSRQPLKSKSPGDGAITTRRSN